MAERHEFHFFVENDQLRPALEEFKKRHGFSDDGSAVAHALLFTVLMNIHGNLILDFLRNGDVRYGIRNDEMRVAS